jgi:dGTPase
VASEDSVTVNSDRMSKTARITSIREQLERREREVLAPQAAKSADTRGRLKPEDEDPIRPAFQRDRDRIIHCKAFRRLKHKTQVFFAPTGDHYRTRLTHTLEVSQIARSIAKVLRLNEELTEAIALGHDLGHTPFGHAGERVLNDLIPGGFNHYEQSLRIVDVLERDGQGLNLTWEVRDGIARHSKGKSGMPVGADPEHRASTLEGQIARVADIIAYVNHDIDDAVRAGLLREEDLPPQRVTVLGQSSSERIGTMVTDVVLQTIEGGLSEIRMSDRILDATVGLRSFLFDAVYENEIATAEFKKAAGILGGLWEKLRSGHRDLLDARTIETDGLDAAGRDFLAGMTDRYATETLGIVARLSSALGVRRSSTRGGGRAEATSGPRRRGARAEKCASGADLTMPLRLGEFAGRRTIGWTAR